MPASPEFSAKGAFYKEALRTLNESTIPYILGGAYALRKYTGIERYTKDLDVFVKERDCRRVLDLFECKGFAVDLLFPHWLGKIYCGDEFVDVIFSSGNGLCLVDDDWFRYAAADEIFGFPVLLSPPEEMIWSKGFIMERDRFDGADIAHLLNACAERIHWPRLLRRFGRHWRVLFAHLILFGFIYPDARNRIPAEVLRILSVNLSEEMQTGSTGEKYCQGTYLSLIQYLVDVQRWGYCDARLKPWGRMSREEIDHWTSAFAEKIESTHPPVDRR
jgi:hypothetical protein